ncbi:MAG: XRE family transcriptional regulator [Bacteroidales bacterium]|nr:XRE family transcriptional regulator [Bacteroidales bacterium]
MAETVDSDFHLGRLIRQELIRQKRSVTWLADCINCDRTNCYCIFERQYIDIELLKRISRALNHNFFNELAAYMESVVKVSTDVS